MSPNFPGALAASPTPWTLRPTDALEVRWVLTVNAVNTLAWLTDQARCSRGCHDAELANETWMRAIVSSEKYDPKRGALGQWLKSLMRGVCLDAHRRRGRGGRLETVAHGDMSEFAQGDGLDPEREVALREGLGYAVEDLDPRSIRLLFADELESKSLEELAQELGLAVSSVYMARTRAKAQARPRREHVFALLPLLFGGGTEGRSARQELWAWITSGWRAVSLGVTALALTAGGAFHLGQQSGRRPPQETRPTVVAARPAVVETVPRSEAALVPTVVGSAPPAAVRSSPELVVDPAVRSVSRPSGAESARAARVLIDEAEGLFGAHPAEALRRAEQAARVAPRVDEDRRESLRCVALGRLHRDAEAAACARDFQRRWPRSPLASQVAALRPSSAP